MSQINHEALGSGTNLTPASMNSLGVLQTSSQGATFNNTSARDLYANFVVEIGATANRASVGLVSVHFLFSVDGTNWETLNITTNDTIGYVNVPTGTASTRKIFPRVQIPPMYFAVYVQNSLPVSLGASGNVITAYPTSLVQS